jgi:hypothetical protein
MGRFLPHTFSVTDFGVIFELSAGGRVSGLTDPDVDSSAFDSTAFMFFITEGVGATSAWTSVILKAFSRDIY